MGIPLLFFKLSVGQWRQLCSISNWQLGCAMLVFYHINYCFHVFFSLCLNLPGLSTMVAAFYTAMVGMKAAKKIHETLLNNIMKCPLSLFESLPVGRILNRFSSDIAIVDYVLPFTYRSIVNCVLTLLVTIAVISSNQPWFAAVIMLTAIPYAVIQVCKPALWLTIRCAVLVHDLHQVGYILHVLELPPCVVTLHNQSRGSNSNIGNVAQTRSSLTCCHCELLCRIPK